MNLVKSSLSYFLVKTSTQPANGPNSTEVVVAMINEQDEKHYFVCINKQTLQVYTVPGVEENPVRYEIQTFFPSTLVSNTKYSSCKVT